MGKSKKVFLSRNPMTGTHSLVIVVPSSCQQSRSGMLDIHTMNRLMRWKALDQLIDVLDETGPLVSNDINVCGIRRRPVREVAETVGKFGKLLSPDPSKDASDLLDQLYLVEGPSYTSPSFASVARSIESHGLLENGAAEVLRSWAMEDPDAKVIVEPIADFVTARNLCSVTLRIVANYQDPDVDDVLEASGFKHIQKGTECYYIVPFQRGMDMTRTLYFIENGVPAMGFLDTLYPVLRLILTPDLPRRTLNDRLPDAFLFPSSTAVPDLDEHPVVSVWPKSSSAGEMLYLAIRRTGTQRATAESFMHALESAFDGLANAFYEPLGWDFSKLPALSANDAPEPVFHTLFAAMVGTVVFRTGMVPITCKNCGNAFFIRPKGKKREFCSDSCRSRYSAGNASRND